MTARTGKGLRSPDRKRRDDLSYNDSAPRGARLFGFFEHGFFADDGDDALFADVITAAIGFEVVADFGVFGQNDVAIDDGVADAGMAADIDVVEDDGIFHFAEAIHAHVEADHATLHTASGNDGASAADGA